MDVFYIEILQGVFDQDFGLQNGANVQEMALNIEDLLGLLRDTSPDIAQYPISGAGIVQGDPTQINLLLEIIASLIGLDEMLAEGEGDMMDEQDPEQLEELAEMQQKLMMENNQNTMQGRGQGAGTMHGDPRDIRKQRKAERQQQEQEENLNKGGKSPQKAKKNIPVSNNPLDQFAAMHSDGLDQEEPADEVNNQFGSQPQLNQFGNQPQLNQFGGQPQLNQFGGQPQLNQFQQNNPQLNQFQGNSPQLNQFQGNNPQLNQFQNNNPQLNQFQGSSQPLGGGGLVPFGQVSNQPFGAGGGDPLAPFGQVGNQPIGGAAGGTSPYDFEIDLDIPKEIKIPPNIETELEEEESDEETESEKDKKDDEPEEGKIQNMIKMVEDNGDGMPKVWDLKDASDLSENPDELMQPATEFDNEPVEDPHNSSSYERKIQEKKKVMNTTESFDHVSNSQASKQVSDNLSRIQDKQKNNDLPARPKTRRKIEDHDDAVSLSDDGLILDGLDGDNETSRASQVKKDDSKSYISNLKNLNNLRDKIASEDWDPRKDFKATEKLKQQYLKDKSKLNPDERRIAEQSLVFKKK